MDKIKHRLLQVVAAAILLIFLAAASWLVMLASVKAVLIVCTLAILLSVMISASHIVERIEAELEGLSDDFDNDNDRLANELFEWRQSMRRHNAREPMAKQREN